MKDKNLKPSITLIYPGIGICGFGQLKKRGERFVEKNVEINWIHHGLASIGSSLKSKGYDVKLIDMRTLDSWEHFKKISENMNSEIIGISISNVDYKVAMKAVEIIRGVKPSTKIIVGGLNPTIFPEMYQNNEKIDYIVTGEGEITLVKIIQGIENNISVPKFNKGEKPDLNKLPWVDRTLFDYSRELNCPNVPDQKLPTVTMIAGRGCPYQCTYCQPAERLTYGRPHRIRSPQNVISELITLKNKYDFKSINFLDDTFTLNKKWIFEFCDLYEKEKFDATISACSRADIICRDEDMVKRLSEIGLDWFTIGFESGSQRILNLIKKGTTVEQNYKAASICKKYGIKIVATFMLGLPTETKREQWATTKMIIETQPEYPHLFYFLPIMGTEIYDFCKEKNLILSNINDDPFNIGRTGVFNKPRIKNINYRFLDMLRARIYLPYLIKSALKKPTRIIPYLREKSKNIENLKKEVE